MNKITLAIAVMLVAISTIANAECTTCHAGEEKVPQIIYFSSEGIAHTATYGSAGFMQESEKMALTMAKQWIFKNYSHVNIISHSVTGNWVGRNSAWGFTTVTILYTEK